MFVTLLVVFTLISQMTIFRLTGDKMNEADVASLMASVLDTESDEVSNMYFIWCLICIISCV